MAVAILIQCDVDAENQEEVFDLLRQLRARAVPQPGYISGETLFSATKSGTHLVISRWRSLKDWRGWENSPERREIVSKIDPLLTAPAITSVYLDSHARCLSVATEKARHVPVHLSHNGHLAPAIW